MKKLSLNQQTIISVVLAIICGLIFGEKFSVLQPVGNIYLNLIKSLIIPVVFCSVCSSIANNKDLTKLGGIAAKTLILFIFTTAMAATISLIVSSALGAGKGIVYSEEAMTATVEIPAVKDIILNMFPSNIVDAMATGNNMQVIIFAALMGIGIVVAGKSVEPVKDGINRLMEVCFSMTKIVLKFSPVGIFCLLGSAIGRYGTELVGTVGIFIVAVYLANIIMIAVDFLLIAFIARVPLKKFAKAAWIVGITAFTTRSSGGTLPLTIETAKEVVGVPDDVANFVLPLGATINMNGAAVMIAGFGVFAANACGLQLTASQYAIAVFACVITGVGMPGVPGSGIVFSMMLLSTLGLPTGMIALVSGLDNLTDMADTACNVIGDMTTATLVGSIERKKAAI